MPLTYGLFLEPSQRPPRTSVSESLFVCLYKIFKTSQQVILPGAFSQLMEMFKMKGCKSYFSIPSLAVLRYVFARPFWSYFFLKCLCEMSFFYHDLFKKESFLFRRREGVYLFQKSFLKKLSFIPLNWTFKVFLGKSLVRKD